MLWSMFIYLILRWSFTMNISLALAGQSFISRPLLYPRVWPLLWAVAAVALSVDHAGGGLQRSEGPGREEAHPEDDGGKGRPSDPSWVLTNFVESKVPHCLNSFGWPCCVCSWKWPHWSSSWRICCAETDMMPVLSLPQGEAAVYMEPEKQIMSRSGDQCVVALCDQW